MLAKRNFGIGKSVVYPYPTSWNIDTKKNQGRIFPHHNNRETCVWDCVTTTNSNTQIFYQRLFSSKQFTYTKGKS